VASVREQKTSLPREATNHVLGEGRSILTVAHDILTEDLATDLFDSVPGEKREGRGGGNRGDTLALIAPFPHVVPPSGG
jgi:hypothetical protein